MYSDWRELRTPRVCWSLVLGPGWSGSLLLARLGARAGTAYGYGVRVQPGIVSVGPEAGASGVETLAAAVPALELEEEWGWSGVTLRGRSGGEGRGQPHCQLGPSEGSRLSLAS